MTLRYSLITLALSCGLIGTLCLLGVPQDHDRSLDTADVQLFAGALGPKRSSIKRTEP